MSEFAETPPKTSPADPLFEDAPVPMVVVDGEGKLLRTNHAARQALPLPESSSDFAFAFWPPDREAVRHGLTSGLPWRARTREGIRVFEGRVGTTLGGRIVSLQELPGQSCEVDWILAAPVGMAFLDADHRFVQINEVLARYNDIEREAHLGQRMEELLPGLPPEVGEAIDSVFALAQPAPSVEFASSTGLAEEEGSYWRVLFYPVFDDRGRVRYAGAVVEETTNDHRTEEALRKGDDDLRRTASRLGQALEVGKIGIWSWDVVANRIEWTDQINWIHGVPPGSFAGTYEAYEAFVHPEDWNRLQEVGERVLESGKDYEVAYRIVRPDGCVRWIECRAHVERNEAQEAVHVVGLLVDVTDRRQAEERFRAAAEGSFDAFFILRAVRDKEGKLVDFVFEELNHRGTDLLGMSREELIGERLCELLPANRELGFFDKYRRVVETGIALEEEFGHCGGGHTDHWFHQQVVPLGDGVAITTRDMTDRKRVEERLRESEARFRNMADAAPVLIWISDLTKACIYFNQVWLDFTGRTSEQEYGFGWAEGVHPEDYDRCVAIYTDHFDRQEPFRMEYRLRRHDGVYRWILDHGVPRMTPDGVFEGFIGSCIDITDRIEAEARVVELNQTLEARVDERTRELMEANQELEGFTYSVSHDLRAPLRAINSSSHILLQDYRDHLDEGGVEQLERQARNAKRMADLIDDLLRLSRIGRHEMVKSQIDLRSMGYDLLGEIAPRHPDVSIEIDFSEGLEAEGDPRLIRLMLENLVDNACKFARDGLVHIQVGKDDQGYFLSDDGIGFDPQYADRIFRPFERLHRDDQIPGTGIGLANVKRIVERHGGRVWAESEPGKGTTFRFTL